MLQLELQKIIGRRFFLMGLVAISILFLAAVYMVTQLHVIKDGATEGMYVRDTSWAILSYSSLYLCLPLFVIVFVGQEITGGHMNRVVFQKSRSYYFGAKFLFTFLISMFFTLLGSITLFICVVFSPFGNLNVGPGTYVQFFLQSLISNELIAMLLLSLLIIIRNPVVVFVCYFFGQLIERVLFGLVQAFYKVELVYLPLQLTRSFYSRDVSGRMETYFPLSEYFHSAQAVALVVIPLVLYLSYLVFAKADLKPLSD
jgi:hypothetical protein